MGEIAYEDPLATLFLGDCREVMAGLPAESVQCCITSPPYLGLRNYKIPPLIWGGQGECGHEWGKRDLSASNDSRRATMDWQTGGAPGAKVLGERVSQGQFCAKCGGWLGSLGLEPSPEMYVEHIVEVFRAVRRVLRSDSTCWVNLGDSFSVGSNLFNEIQSLIEGPLVLIGGRPAISITPKRSNIPENHDGLPESKLVSLLGVQRITVKEGDDNLGQVLYLLNTEGCARISSAIRFVMIEESHIQLILDEGQDISIIISELDTDVHPIFGIASLTRAGKQTDCSLTIKEATEPIAEVIGNGKVVRDTIMGDSFSKGSLNINFVDYPIPLGDAFSSAIGHCGDLKITKASAQQFSLLICDSRVNLTFGSVAHLYSSNRHSSLIRYQELYHKANERANEKQAKQELGIPEMVKRALMQDGWICRSTIIWSKPNPMPESVSGSRWERHRVKVGNNSAALKERYEQSENHGGSLTALSSLAHMVPVEWEDCPGCPVCLPNDGLVLRRGSWRPTTAHEYIFMLAKSENYYADGEAVREPHSRDWGLEGWAKQGYQNSRYADGEVRQPTGLERGEPAFQNPHGRNKRSVWEITTQPFAGAHFATFPEKLVEPCLLAGTSEKGACPKCGKAWVRVISNNGIYPMREKHPKPPSSKLFLGEQGENRSTGFAYAQTIPGVPCISTLGWRPACACGEAEAVPCLVLDPFAGSGTVGVVARQWGRKAILIELSEAYCKLVVKRLTETQPAMAKGE